MKAHFCLSKKENIDSDFDGIIEIQVNTETPGFQVILILIILYHIKFYGFLLRSYQVQIVSNQSQSILAC